MAVNSALRRILRHLFIPSWAVKRPFTPAVLRHVEQAISASETKHNSELRFAFEGSLPLALLLSRPSARTRAHDVFAQLRVWDTEHNSGVLIYLQLIDRRVEIVADRGIARKVEQSQWNAICRAMEHAFKQGRFEEGVLAAIGTITELLVQNFPPVGDNPNELPDRPVVL